MTGIEHVIGNLENPGWNTAANTSAIDEPALKNKSIWSLKTAAARDFNIECNKKAAFRRPGMIALVATDGIEPSTLGL
jgi:hypothetical protein